MIARRSANFPDVIVVGAGAVGACTALYLARRGARVLVIEKESHPARHQSGRNSGVIHAGYNLAPGSTKARYCVEGSRRLRSYCWERGIPMRQHGILVVAGTESAVPTIAELKRRSDANGVEAMVVDERGIRAIEPHARGVQALHAPEGASFDSQGFVRAVLADAIGAGAEVRYDVRVDAAKPDSPEGAVQLRTSDGVLRSAALVNCAGLQADRLAGPLARDLRVIPFRGYYAELQATRRDLVKSHIYAAPDLSFPFLGVHASRRVDGRVLLGPGAMLAFGREAYRFHQANVRDLAATFAWPGFYRLLGQRRFRSLIVSEVHKSLRLRAIWNEARAILPALEPGDLTRAFAGNRAQLVSRDGALVGDILIRETRNSVHVLNAVSPGLTCSLPFGEHLAGLCLEKLNGAASPVEGSARVPA